MIRRATEADIPAIVEMGAEFHEFGPYRDIPYDPEATGAFVGGVIHAGAVFIHDQGMIGGCLVPLYFNPRHFIASELFWWAKRDGRGLLRAFEGWARETGARAVTLSALETDRVNLTAKLFERLGYQRREIGFLKEFA